MSFGRNNFFDDENRRGFRNVGNFDNESTFGNFSNNNSSNNFDNMRNIRRQRSPIFSERDQLDSQMSSNNFASFPNRNADFGYQPQQQQTQAESSKVYHVPIHIEKDDAKQSNSYIKISEQQSNQPTNQSNNYSNNQNPHQNQSNQQYHQNANFPPSNLSLFREQAEQEFRRQQEELRNNTANPHNQSSQHANQQQQQTQQGEYRIPIRIEGDPNEPNNLVRDFNKMHCPSAVRTSKPGQKNSTPNDFKEFNNVNTQYQNAQFIPQQQEGQSQSVSQEQQSPQPSRKSVDPIAIIQEILDEVEKYEHEIDNFTGEYQDKQYRYLDEYLTRCMLKLDTIDTNDANLKQARKNAIHYINKVITKLEKLEHNHKDTSNEMQEVKMEQEHAEEGAKSKDANQEDESEQGEKLNDDSKQQEEEKINQGDKLAQDSTQNQDSKESDEKPEKVDGKKSEKKKTSKKCDGKDKKKIKKDDN